MNIFRLWTEPDKNRDAASGFLKPLEPSKKRTTDILNIVISLTISGRNKCPMYQEILSGDRHLRIRNEILGPFGDFGQKQRNMAQCLLYFWSLGGLRSFQIRGNRDKPTYFQVAHFFF